MKKHQLIDLLGGSIEVETAENTMKQLPVVGIEIPIIQRDYAQGRLEERVILNRFLGAIFGALANDEELELDFIYGSIREASNGAAGTFLPLDGQQRLTTLYLLNWYIGNAELAETQLKAFRERLSGFKYATRGTATRFCEKLAEIGDTDNVAKHIRQAYWFHKNFEKDPTVMAMLNTIQEIEQRYKQQSDLLFDRLSRLCFYLLPLDGFNLTEELYIKMNARGKQLTDFENFKADFIGRLKDDKHPESAHFHEEVGIGVTTMPYYLAIASKIDNSWTDIFWPVAKKNEKDEDKVVDPYFLRFINRYVLSQHLLYGHGTVAELENSPIFRFFYGQGGTDVQLRYRQFEQYSRLTSENAVARFERLMDNLNKHQDTIRHLIRPSWEPTSDWFLFDEKISQTQRILFWP